MLDWKRPELCDQLWVSECVRKEAGMGSDTAFANIYLLRNKYNIEIASYKGFLLRRYYGKGARLGYTFPVGQGNINQVIEALVQDAKARNEKLRFAFVTDEQKEMLEKCLPKQFRFTTIQDDTDYIYSCQSLANLSGRAYHKKKNHVLKFMRTYQDFMFQELGDCNWEDAMKVEDIWYKEHSADRDTSSELEYDSIREAVDNHEELALIGGIIYVNGKPVAMTIASHITDDVVDVHFEKAIGEYAINGGFSAINNCFAKSLEKVSWLNREEDIGIEGLRKAKLSYHPQIMLNKYSATLI